MCSGPARASPSWFCSLFPSPGVPFPKNFLQICKKILCRLFRVFVHVYIHHFDRVIVMGAEAHVNTCYKHFYYFVTEMNLIDRKELEPLVSVTVYWLHPGHPRRLTICHRTLPCPCTDGRLLTGRLQNWAGFRGQVKVRICQDVHSIQGLRLSRFGPEGVALKKKKLFPFEYLFDYVWF